MKRLNTVLAATAALLAATAARADTRFSIGVHVGAPVFRTTPPVVVYAPPPVVSHVAPPVRVYTAPRGYWSDVVVKTWVPERWVVSRDRWGRPVRHCEPGYFTYRTERVWVEGRDHCRPTEPAPAYAHGRWGR